MVSLQNCLQEKRHSCLPLLSVCPRWHLHLTFIVKGVSGDGPGSRYLLRLAPVGLFSCGHLLEQPQILPLCRGWLVGCSWRILLPNKLLCWVWGIWLWSRKVSTRVICRAKWKSFFSVRISCWLLPWLTTTDFGDFWIIC